MRHFGSLKDSAASIAVPLGDGRLLFECELSALPNLDVLVVAFAERRCPARERSLASPWQRHRLLEQKSTSR